MLKCFGCAGPSNANAPKPPERDAGSAEPAAAAAATGAAPTATVTATGSPQGSLSGQGGPQSSGSQGSKRSSLVPAKRNGDGKVKHRVSDATISEASIPEASSSTGEGSVASGANGLPASFNNTIATVIQKLADACGACIANASKAAKSSKPVDARRRLLENAWSMNAQNAPQFRVAMNLHILVQFILRYRVALPAIMAASSDLQLPGSHGKALQPSAHPLFELILFKLPPAVLSLSGLPSMYSPLLVSSMVRFAAAVNMRSKELGGSIISLVFAQMKKYRAALDATPPSGKISGKHAFMPVPDAAVTYRMHVYTELLQMITSSSVAPWGGNMSRDAARALRDAGAVSILPQILETVSFGGRAGLENAMKLLGVLAGAVHVDQNGVSKIRSFMQQALRGSRLTGSPQDMHRIDQTGQRLLRNNVLLSGLDGGSTTPTAAVSAAELAANMHMNIGNSNAEVAQMHPSFLRNMLSQGVGRGGRGQATVIELMHDALNGMGGGGRPQNVWMSQALPPSGTFFVTIILVVIITVYIHLQ